MQVRPRWPSFAICRVTEGTKNTCSAANYENIAFDGTDTKIKKGKNKTKKKKKKKKGGRGDRRKEKEQKKGDGKQKKKKKERRKEKREEKKKQEKEERRERRGTPTAEIAKSHPAVQLPHPHR